MGNSKAVQTEVSTAATDPEVERLRRRIYKLSDSQLLELHRIVARAAKPVYDRVYAGNWEAGMAASRWKRVAKK